MDENSQFSILNSQFPLIRQTTAWSVAGNSKSEIRNPKSETSQVSDNSKLKTRRQQRPWFKARPKEEPMNHPLMAVRHRARRARVTQNSKLKTQNFD